IRYSASNVPILQVALQSDSLSEQQLFDYGVNFVRTDIATIQGAQIPYPYGGKQRLIMIDIDPQRLFAWGLSPRDLNTAIGQQNVIVPTGTAKIGANEFPIVLNASPDLLAQIEAIPVKVVKGTTVYVRDVAHVRDGYSPQTNIVHVEGQRSVLMSILKQGSASTLDIVRRVRDVLPTTLARLPKELKVALLFDQSIFVRASIEGDVKEAMIAAGLTALMLLVFLGSWRSTLIVIVPVVFISGSAKFLFIPLAMSVVFAMLTSYFLSRTLVPTMMHYLMASEAERHAHESPAPPTWFGARLIAAFERGFERLRMNY